MTWYEDVVTAYLKSVPVHRISYSHFLNQSAAVIRERINADTEWQTVDSQLFKCFKSSLPQNASSKALRRSRVERYWLDLMPDPVASASTNYENTALRLLDQARRKKEKEISAMLQGAGQVSTPSQTSSPTTTTTTRKRSHESSTATDEYDLEDSFADLTAADRVRSLISKYRIDTNHVATLHKQE